MEVELERLLLLSLREQQLVHPFVGWADPWEAYQRIQVQVSQKGSESVSRRQDEDVKEGRREAGRTTDGRLTSLSDALRRLWLRPW